MRNGYNNHHHHLHQKGTFLPMLCSKPSLIKDVHVPHTFNKKHSSSARRVEDPSLSPKLGCMGQVKKQHQNYKLGMVFPTSATTSTHPNPNPPLAHTTNFRYSKLFRLFSSITPPSLLSSTKNSTNICCRRDQQQQQSHVAATHSGGRVRSRSCEDGIIGFGSPINVADLDPPLPVMIKKKTSSSPPQVDGQVSENEKNSSLWKRRSGGAALKGLQIQQLHIPPIQSTIST